MALEEASRVDPATIIRDHIDPHIGLLRYQVTNIASNMYLAREYWRPLTRIAQDLYRCFVESDATLAEINPLAITEDGDLIALDGKMIIDDNALFRQKEMAAHRDTEAEADAETRARKVGLSYVHLEGQIGCMVNGAGLAMALMDMIKAYGAQDGITPANFLDIGGGATANKVTAGLEIILSVPDVRTVVLNIFGGITRCDEVAQGIITTYENLRPSIPLIVRLQGTNMAEGRAILRSSGIESLIYAETLTEIARKAVEAARGVQV
jgi:succinyl-CoA synthetase beta subunit